MEKQFLLFGEEAFEAYANDRFVLIKEDIDKMSDLELLMHEDNFDELLQRHIAQYAFRKLDIVFADQVVDLNPRQTQFGRTIFAEYSLPVTGNTYYLGLIPARGSRGGMRLPIRLNKNILSFEINTCYDHEELPEGIREIVKKEYARIKTFISDSLYNINETVKHFNEELESLLKLLLRDRLNHAKRLQKIREGINFS